MTIKDIARECDCAVGTVSRVLNNHPEVSEKTRAKVLAVVKKYNFVLNVNAKQLKTINKKTFVIIVKGTTSMLLNRLLALILNHIESSIYSANVIIIDEHDDEVERAKKIYYEQKPVGIIFLGGTPEGFNNDFAETAIPCVMISNQADNANIANLSSVGTNDFDSAAAMTKYLLENNHRKIGVIGGDLSKSDLSKRRLKGFLHTYAQTGLEFDSEKAYVTANFSMKDGARACEELLKKYPDITAIFTMSDSMAMGAIRKLNDLGKRVPEDISVVGYDGTDESQYFCPRLTTIRQNQEQLVETGFEILLNSIESGASSMHISIPAELLIGESVKKL